MLRSALHWQRFHTQDEREMNTEDAGGVTWGLDHASHCPLSTLHCTGLVWSERIRGGGGAEIEVLTPVYDGKGSRWPKTDVLIGFSVISKPSCSIDLWRGTGERAALLVSAGLEEPSSHETETPPLCLQATEPWQIFLFHSMSPGHLKRLLMLAVRLPALPRLALPAPVTSCSLLLHFSEAIIEWTLRQGSRWMDSLVTPPWGLSSSE